MEARSKSGKQDQKERGQEPNMVRNYNHISMTHPDISRSVLHNSPQQIPKPVQFKLHLTTTRSVWDQIFTKLSLDNVPSGQVFLEF